jgi:hypothetical protein
MNDREQASYTIEPVGYGAFKLKLRYKTPGLAAAAESFGS